MAEVESSAIRRTNQEDEVLDLLLAAGAAIRLLQDREAHMPQEMLDPREPRVLRQLRQAVRRVS